jgi:hypothetical protein
MTLLLGGCAMEASKQAAETTAAQMYQARSAKNWEAVLTLYSPEFYRATDREQWKNLLLVAHEKLGEYQSRELRNWQFKSFLGTGGQCITTELVYQVRFSKGEATETLTFQAKGQDTPLKISGHFIRSPLLVLAPATPAAKPAAAGGGTHEPGHLP